MTNNTVLHDEGWHAILEAKFARIISEISKMYLLAELKNRLKISIFLWRKSCASR